jgi:hypothetical protein
MEGDVLWNTLSRTVLDSLIKRKTIMPLLPGAICVQLTYNAECTRVFYAEESKEQS